MNYKDAIKAVEVIAQALRTEEQSNVLVNEELVNLKEDKKYLTGRLTENDQQLEQAFQNERETREKLDTEIRRNGELKATLKQLLAEQMALAGRAAEMLRGMEDKPQITLSPTVQEEFKEELDLKDGPLTWSEKQRINHNGLQKFITKDVADIDKMPVGRVFVLDPPAGKDVKDFNDIKLWYRLIAGKVPSNWSRLPGVEFRKEHSGKHFLRFTAPGQEDKEPLPFRTSERTGTQGQVRVGREYPSFTSTNQEEAQPSEPKVGPFSNDQEIPKFLTKGPAVHDDQRGQP